MENTALNTLPTPVENTTFTKANFMNGDFFYWNGDKYMRDIKIGCLCDYKRDYIGNVSKVSANTVKVYTYLLGKKVSATIKFSECKLVK